MGVLRETPAYLTVASTDVDRAFFPHFSHPSCMFTFKYLLFTYLFPFEQCFLVLHALPILFIMYVTFLLYIVDLLISFSMCDV